MRGLKPVCFAFLLSLAHSTVLLAHELAHLLLSHTLESYTSSSLLIPTLSRLVVDGESL